MSRLIDVFFPQELLLEIIQRIPFEASAIQRLALVHPRIHILLATYERSIVKNYSLRQLPHAFDDFPVKLEGITYAWLSQCIHQYDIIDDVMAVLVSEDSCWAVERHNMPLVNAGLLLLFRLQSIENYTDKLAFIQSLPQDPLTAIFLAVHNSCFTARFHGEGIINQQRYGRYLDANQLSLRNDVEFCFCEGAMNLGPNFISDVLLRKDSDDTKMMCLYQEFAIHDWDLTEDGGFMPPITHGPTQNLETKQRTLYTKLHERIAELTGWRLNKVAGQILSNVEDHNHSLSWVGLAEKARLIQGLDLEARAY